MNPEIEQYAQAFERLRADAAAIVTGLPAAALNWRPVEGDESTNSLAATLTHLAGSVRFWVGEVAGGRPANRDREAEFRAHTASAGELLALLEQAAEVTRQTLSSLPPERLDETVAVRERTVSKRWAVLHAIEHAAVHVGHMQLTRQLWEAQAVP